MHTLVTLSQFLLVVLTPVQMTIFILQPSSGAPFWRSYVSAWQRTFSILGKLPALLFVAGDEAERKKSVVALVWTALSIPGMVLVGSALLLMN